jgi:hypothetical protein
VAAAAIATLSIWMNTIRDPWKLNWNSWAFYEWLINYHAGFVRRGLVGQLIVSKFYGREIWATNYLAFVLGTLYVVCSAVYAITINRLDKRALLYVFAPTGFVLIALANEYYYRKEIIFYIAIFAVSALYAVWRKNKRPILAAGIFVMVIFSSLVFPFVHEAFIFFSTLIFALIIRKISMDWAGPKRSRWIVLSLISLNLAMFIFMSIFKGGSAQCDAIWSSLSPSARSLSPTGNVAGGISAISWSLDAALQLPYRTLLSGLGTYYIFPLALTYLIAGWIHSDSIGEKPPKIYSNSMFLANYFVVCATFAPLFVLGWDWGRWVLGIFIIFTTMVRMDLLLPLNCKVDFNTVQGRALKYVLFAALLFLFLLTRVPECCLVGSGDSLLTNPLKKSLVVHVRKLITGKAPRL